jgi:hypothetical protein
MGATSTCVSGSKGALGEAVARGAESFPVELTPPTAIVLATGDTHITVRSTRSVSTLLCPVQGEDGGA